MIPIATLAERHVVPEVMDDPTLDPDRHHRALQGLARINRLSASSRIVWTPIYRLARKLGVPRLRVLDIATGSGDVPLALWRRARRQGLDLDILGLDVSPRAVEFAQQRVNATQGKVRFETLDVFQEPLPANYDIVMCSLFLHHLDREQAIELLKKMAGAAQQMVLVNDLHRSRLGLLAAEAVCRLTTTSSVVRIDGPRSVRAAFTKNEAASLVREAGLRGAQIESCWPFRFLVTWKKADA